MARIGRGATGEIWRAVADDGGDGQPEVAALKILRRELARDPELIARFEHELAISQRLDHPNAVRVRGGGRDGDGVPYLVMDEILGRPLSTIAATEAPLAPHRVAAIGRQIASALGAAHALGVIHRDLKPENVLVVRRPDGADHCVVFDFGLSLLPSASTRLTAQELRIGTPGYMAPEYLSEGAVDARADLYALGVVLYELASGKMPFVGPASTVFRMQLLTDPPPLASRAEVPGWLGDAVDGLTRRDPEERTPDADAAIRALTPPT